MDKLMLTREEQHLLDVTAAPLAPERRVQLAEFVLSEIHQEPKRKRRRFLGFLAVILAALTVSGGVAYAFIARSEAPKDPYLVYCYRDTTNIEREGHWIGNSIQAIPDLDGKNKPVIPAVSTCAEMWSLGAVSAPGRPPLKQTGNPVPELTACVDKKGYTIVLPADSSICTRLGIPSLR